ncbi:hypothetical protein A2U01_0079143, partial [Trifolium medium]|nr:hypothetical protein [Trifolium medium]
MEVPLHVGLEKPPAMDTYDGLTDPDDHIKNIEAVLERPEKRQGVGVKLR